MTKPGKLLTIPSQDTVKMKQPFSADNHDLLRKTFVAPTDHVVEGRENPYLIKGPALISFSGGRTSAYMLHQILDAHGGTLPDDVHVCFANTGKEREETLRFVHECATRWNVRVRWLEFQTDLRRGYTAADRFNEVGYNSASRNGEPLDRLIARKKALFSTMKGRWCTERCKVGVLHDFMLSIGYARGSYAEVIGFRADERDRVIELPRSERNLDRHFSFPLAQSGIRKGDVNAWWDAAPFNLKLEKGTGNCDHCPFLGDKARIARARLFPDTMPWWKTREATFKFSFGYMSFADIERHIITSPLLPLNEIEADAADSECGAWCAS